MAAADPGRPDEEERGELTPVGDEPSTGEDGAQPASGSHPDPEAGTAAEPDSTEAGDSGWWPI